MIEAGAVDLAAAFVKEFEGLSLAPYLCPAGKKTVGWGHVILEHEPDLNRKIDLAMAEVLLRKDLAWAMLEVQRVGVDLTANQAAALGSLIFNIGVGNWRKSTLRQRLVVGDFDGAAAEFLRWNRAGGKVVAGLVRRRGLEQKLFKGSK